MREFRRNNRSFATLWSRPFRSDANWFREGRYPMYQIDRIIERNSGYRGMGREFLISENDPNTKTTEAN